MKEREVLGTYRDENGAITHLRLEEHEMVSIWVAGLQMHEGTHNYYVRTRNGSISYVQVLARTYPDANRNNNLDRLPVSIEAKAESPRSLLKEKARRPAGFLFPQKIRPVSIRGVLQQAQVCHPFPPPSPPCYNTPITEQKYPQSINKNLSTTTRPTENNSLQS